MIPMPPKFKVLGGGGIEWCLWDSSWKHNLVFGRWGQTPLISVGDFSELVGYDSLEKLKSHGFSKDRYGTMVQSLNTLSNSFGLVVKIE